VYYTHCVSLKAVASLGLVSPEEANDGVTFFPWKSWRFFSHRPLQSGDFFSCRLIWQLPPSLRRTSGVLSKLSHIFFIRVSPPGVIRGAPPPSDATNCVFLNVKWFIFKVYCDENYVCVTFIFSILG